MPYQLGVQVQEMGGLPLQVVVGFDVPHREVDSGVCFKPGFFTVGLLVFG